MSSRGGHSDDAAPPSGAVASRVPAPRTPTQRRATLAVFDLDGTLTRSDTLAPFLLGCLLRRPWRLLRLLAMLPAATRFLTHHDRGALKGALLHATLGGLRREPLQRSAIRFAARVLRHGMWSEAQQALAAHRARGDRLVLMSASTDLYVPQIAAALGFDACICSRVAWSADGRLDGHLAAANCRGEEKRRQLSLLIEREAPERVYAYGNSAADLPHLQLAQVAYLVNGPRHLPPPSAAHVQRLHWRG
jgi:phosphatidylglycerophosphatase C